MKEKTIKSAMPIYAAGIVWFLCGVFIPMYKMTNIIIVFALSIIVYFFSLKLFKDKVILVEVVEKADTGDKTADELLNNGRGLIIEMEKINMAIDDEKLNAQISQLKRYGSKIFDFVEKDVSKARNIRTFMDYYLPTTINLLKNYTEMSQAGLGDNTNRAIEKIESVMDTIVLAFKNQLDSLYEDKTLDIVSEVKVMEEILKREGLAGNDMDIRKKG